jgi:hypothetical protein
LIREQITILRTTDGFTMIAQKGDPSLFGLMFLGAYRIQRSTVRSEISKQSIFSSP